VILFGLNTHYNSQMALFPAIAGSCLQLFWWLPKYLPELYPTRIRVGQGFSYNIGRVLAGLGVLATRHARQPFHGNYASAR